ncbi:type VI secretion system tube protein Hcp [uncultured Arcticibacterium sp.]|uniref:type VI secretion system tube protein Hcp n=1 Tax=uncultured Arcticibacterium sp. TaxID=2173042 RepID=UPI0030F7AF64
MKTTFIKTIVLLCLNSTLIIAQEKKGVSMAPAPELEVNGIIFSSSGGVKFPDGTIQTTAYLNTGSPAMDMDLSGLVIEFDPATGIEGPAEGDGISKGLNVESISEGLSNPSTTHTGGGGGAGAPNFQDFTISRQSDVNSAIFRSYVGTGTHIPYIEVFYLKYTGSKYVIEHKVKYENCIITSFSMSHSEGGTPAESIGINFQKACYCSYTRDAAGAATRTTNFSWDVALNATYLCNCANF